MNDNPIVRCTGERIQERWTGGTPTSTGEHIGMERVERRYPAPQGTFEHLETFGLFAQLRNTETGVVTSWPKTQLMQVVPDAD